jgi:MoaA/NifB/PqqE/SkfB family radical SAM enzyme
MFPLRNLKRFFYKALRQPGYAFGVLIRRLQANLSYIFAKGRSSYPEAITLFLTHRCNLQCKMCGQWGREGVSKRQSAQYIQAELSLNELQLIIDDTASFKPNITLFGGEPLLHPGFPEIIKYIKQKGIHCLVVSNGFLLEELAEGIVDSGLDELNVSLDGNSALHDQIRGMPGLFDKIMHGLKQINYFKTRKNKHKPLINLQCTITQYNYKYLEQLIDVANEANADSLTFHNLIFINRQVMEKQKAYDNLLGCNSLDWEGFIFEPGIEPEVLYEKMKKILSGRYSFSVDFYPNLSHKALLEYYRKPDYRPCGNACCLSPWVVAYIFPDGEVRPCLNSSYSFGNIKQMRFTEIWNNAKAVGFRKILKKNKIFPVCARCTELYRY